MATTTIATEPRAGQTIEHDGKTYTTIREGRAFILVPPNTRTSVDPQAKSKADDGSQAQNVFYNPIQQFNRDLSVLAIKAFGEDACQRKRQRHEEHRAKEKRKRETKQKRASEKEEKRRKEVEDENRKRAAEPDDEVDADADGRPRKPRRLEDGSRVFSQDETQAEQTIVEEQQDESANAREDGEIQPQPAGDENDQVMTNGDGHEPPAQDTPGQPQQTWRPKFRILDALSATGLRALRYASEIPFATAVVANDRELNATNAMKVNVEHNNLSAMITTTTGDALGHMYSVAFPSPDSHGPDHICGRYDVIDLDPYGTAAPFIDAALQALEDGGLLCVTCTDSGVFASCGYSEKTFALYGGLPIKGPHSHEGGLRLILHSIATSASKYGLAIEPLLSLSIDFYARLFIRVRKSPLDVKFLAGKTMLVYGCDHGCGAWAIQPIGRHVKQKNSENNWKYTIGQSPTSDRTCVHCGSKQHLAGPMWGGPLHNPAFVEKMLTDLKEVDEEVYQTKPRIEGMLDTALDEMIVNCEAMDFRNVPTKGKNGEKDIIPKTPPEAIDHHPFFFTPSALCKVVKARAPAEALIKGAIRHAGYRATRSHCKPGSIKTDAPWEIIWEIIREWVRQRAPIKEGALLDIHPGWKILQATRTVAPVPLESNSDAATIAQDVDTTDDVEMKGNDPVEAEAATATEETNQSRSASSLDPKRLEVVFDEKLGQDKPGKRLVRYQENPRENWGPMRRAQGSRS